MAKLTDNPTDWELEDFLAAHLVSRGRYVECGVTEREPDDILELDVVATDYSTQPAATSPFEVKSGKWGLTDLFKFQGWMTYLDLDGGVFVHTVPATKPDGVARVSAKLGMTTMHVIDPKDETALQNQFAQLLALGAPVAPYLPDLWRYSFWAQRRLFTSIQAALKYKKAPLSGEAAKNYFRLVNDAVFFEPDIRVRVKKLLEAHLQHPKLALTMCHELAGRPVDFSNPVDCDEYKRVIYQGELLPVQACMYFTHRARLYILKALIDYSDALNAGFITKEVLKFGGIEIDITHADLYRSFRDAMAQFGNKPNFRRYPLVWQTLLLSWGGFLLTPHRATELAALAAETGVPVDELPYALNAFDFLFPTAKGWWRTMGDIELIQQMPPALIGLGAVRRLMMYGKNEYDDLGLSGYGASDLAKCHNTTKRLLDAADADLPL